MLKKKESPNDQQPVSNPYSKDVDQTRFLWMAFGLAMTTLIGLFLLEFFHKPIKDEHVLFTPEIIHILVNGLAIGFFGLGAYIYGKNVGANEALAKMVGGGNGNQTEVRKTQQQPQEGQTKQGEKA